MSDYVKPICATLLPHAGGYLGSFLFKDGPKSSWYRGLKTPSYSPPQWLAAPASAVCYACMGYGSYIVWRRCGGFQGDAVLPLSCYAANLACMWANHPLTFALKRTDVSFVSMLMVVGATTATVWTFYKVNQKAGLLVLPFLAWSSYAAFLNFAMWKMNKLNALMTF